LNLNVWHVKWTTMFYPLLIQISCSFSEKSTLIRINDHYVGINQF